MTKPWSRGRDGGVGKSSLTGWGEGDTFLYRQPELVFVEGWVELYLAAGSRRVSAGDRG